MEKSKKNNKRLGIVLVALMMIVAIGATAGYTLARYITTGTQSGQATVAKWGVTITAGTDKMFGDKYKSGAIVTSDENLSVSAAKDAVAPGTNGSVKFTINGEPEVRSQLDLAFGKGSNNEEFTLVYLEYETGKYYYPIKWKVGTSNVVVDGAENMAPAAYKTALETAFVTAFKTALGNNGSNIFEVGQKFESKEVTISWTWDLYKEVASGSDGVEKKEDEKTNEYDTILGNLAASKTFYDANDTYKDKYGSSASADTKLAYSVDVKVFFDLTLKQIQ